MIKYFFLPALFFFGLINLPLQAQIAEGESMPVYGDCKGGKKSEVTNCSNQNLINFISANLEYPPAASMEQIEGTVVLGFTINENGAVTEAEVIRDIGGGCGAEGLRLLEMMPNWKPGIKDGLPVKVNLKLPISFNLGNERPEPDQAYRILWGTISNRSTITPAELNANLIAQVFVLDESGNKIPMNELLFSITKKRRYQDASSTGAITADMKALVQKVKQKQIFTAVATVQVDGRFVFVEKEWEVVKE